MNRDQSKPTIEQLKAELEWQRRHDRFLRRAAVGLAALAVAVVLSAARYLPRGGVCPAYTVEETIPAEPETAGDEIGSCVVADAGNRN